MTHHHRPQSGKGRRAPAADRRDRAARARLRIQPPPHPARHPDRTEFHAGRHVSEGKSRAAALSAAQDRVCVRRDLQSAGDGDHASGQSAQDRDARRSLHAGHAGGARTDHLVGRNVRACLLRDHSAPHLRQNGGQASARKTSCSAASWAAARPPSAASSRA